jgi:chemotaxis protein MotB
MADYGNRPIIIKKVKATAHAHHGGAWKIAYADFVTAMMAFFLLLWLISMTTPEQKQGLANYFAPPNIAPTTSGSGGLLGGMALDDTGAKMAASTETTQTSELTPKGAEFGIHDGTESGKEAKDGSGANTNKSAESDLTAVDDLRFHSAAASIQQAWKALPDITKMADNLLIEETVDGLNLVIADQQGNPMFPEGSKYPFEMTRQAIAAIAPILQQLPNRITISGHTAAGGKYENPRYGSWDLSTDRANIVRSILGEFGLSEDHVQSVIGRSTTEPFFPNDPYLAANERIEITVLYEAPPVPAGLTP